MAHYRPSHLPFPENIVITPASKLDLNVHKQNRSNLPNRTFYGYKIYCDAQFLKNKENSCNSRILSLVKALQNQPDVLKQRDKVANDLYSRTVSSVRQLIESLFNWIIEKTDIHRASKVRFIKGLLV